MAETSYYGEDDPRISFPEAESLVNEFARKEGDTTATVSATEVAEWADIEASTHNRTRIHDVLERESEVVMVVNRRKRFAVPDEPYFEVGGDETGGDDNV